MRYGVFCCLLGCVTPFDPAVSTGTWKESDYRAEFNSACSAAGLFKDALNLQYAFGETSDYLDTGGFYSTSIDALQTYSQNIWGLCSSYSAYADGAFYCDSALLLTQYDKWKDAFLVEQVHQEQGCTLSVGYAYTDGLFISDTEVRLVQYFEVYCIDESSQSSLRTCAGTVSSLWTKQ